MLRTIEVDTGRHADKGTDTSSWRVMTVDDREHWDQRYRDAEPRPDDGLAPPRDFAHLSDIFPTSGLALDVACGRGRGSVWLALRGMEVSGIDVSPVAIESARHLADDHGCGDRCRFDVVDLDDGLPDGPLVDLVLCHRFRGVRLDRQLSERLAPGGLLAVSALSEVDAEPGRFRARPGELRDAFAHLDQVVEGESDGVAWLIARRRGAGPTCT